MAWSLGGGASAFGDGCGEPPVGDFKVKDMSGLPSLAIALIFTVAVCSSISQCEFVRNIVVSSSIWYVPE
jgi:hypothetical protein